MEETIQSLIFTALFLIGLNLLKICHIFKQKKKKKKAKVSVQQIQTFDLSSNSASFSLSFLIPVCQLSNKFDKNHT